MFENLQLFGTNSPCYRPVALHHTSKLTGDLGPLDCGKLTKRTSGYSGLKRSSEVKFKLFSVEKTVEPLLDHGPRLLRGRRSGDDHVAAGLTKLAEDTVIASHITQTSPEKADVDQLWGDEDDMISNLKPDKVKESSEKKASVAAPTLKKEPPTQEVLETQKQQVAETDHEDKSKNAGEEGSGIHEPTADSKKDVPASAVKEDPQTGKESPGTVTPIPNNVHSKKDSPDKAINDEKENVADLADALASAVKENPQTPEEVESPEGIDSSDADPKRDFPVGNAGTDENKNVPKLQDHFHHSNMNVLVADAVKEEIQEASSAGTNKSGVSQRDQSESAPDLVKEKRDPVASPVKEGSNEHTSSNARPAFDKSNFPGGKWVYRWMKIHS